MGSLTIETDRLVLRGFTAEDLDEYARINADAEVRRWFPSVLSREDTWRELAMWLGHWALRGFGMWAVDERASGALIGRVGLHQPEGWPGLEVGWLLDRRRWGKGYAPEAARAVAEHAFDALGATGVISLIRPENTNSVRVAQKLGMRADGTWTIRDLHHDIWRLGAP